MTCGAEHLGLWRTVAGVEAHELEERISENVEKVLEPARSTA